MPKKIGEKMSKLPKKESQTVEFKTSFDREAIETLVAFSNATGGSVYLGITDAGDVKGVSVDRETVAAWINEVRNKTAPALIPIVETVEINDKTVVIFKIPEYPIKPVSIKGRYYKRIKNTNQLLTITDVVNLHLQSINSSWDAYPDALHTLEDISLEKVQGCIEAMREKGMTITDSPLTFLLKFSLLRNEQPTNAAYLMFKNSHSTITTIELGRFQDNITIKDTARTQSDIITQVSEVMEFVKKHINLEIIITGEPQNVQRWQYPLEAIREIVLNMIIHRDYRSTADSIVKIFNDKIEFYNPGKLPDDITVDDLLSNNYKSSPRNRSIADFFKNLGLIEKYGSGIGRIIGYFKEASLPEPEFRNISGGFQVTVFSSENAAYVPENVIETEWDVTGNSTESSFCVENNTESNTENGFCTKNNTENLLDVPESTENVPESEGNVPESTENVPESEGNVPENRIIAIIDLIRNNAEISMLELSEVLNVSHKTIKRDMQTLKSKGLVERVGPDKGGHWKVVFP